jgi:hypothetical protein
MSRRAHSAKTVAALVALVLGLALGADLAVSQEGDSESKNSLSPETST